jgi:hypothetical protein
LCAGHEEFGGGFGAGCEVWCGVAVFECLLFSDVYLISVGLGGTFVGVKKMLESVWGRARSLNRITNDFNDLRFCHSLNTLKIV